ncbi:MAG: hypothetical protein JO072_17515 [Parafilimonas sp.]|nr:hypothetical protein [Parafilimonas sp.]
MVLLCHIFILTQKICAQTTDTTAVDSTSMLNIDSTGTSSYDDNDDGYVDTTVAHVYDTSQYFFNWKTYAADPFTTEKVAQRHLIDQDVKQLKSEEDFWYVPAIEKIETRLKNDPKYRDSLLNAKDKELRDENDENFTVQPWFITLIWIIVITIFVGAIAYFLMQNKISIFSRAPASSGDEDTNEEDEDIFHLSYTKLIQQSEKDKNYRVAIRLMFLQILKQLSDSNRIQYQPDHTNLHYLQQLRQSKFYDEFFKVMRSYEYVWYGKFDISVEQYTAIKNDFLKLQNRIA